MMGSAVKGRVVGQVVGGQGGGGPRRGGFGGRGQEIEENLSRKEIAGGCGSRGIGWGSDRGKLARGSRWSEREAGCHREKGFTLRTPLQAGGRRILSQACKKLHVLIFGYVLQMGRGCAPNKPHAIFKLQAQ